MMNKAPENVDAYMAALPEPQRSLLQQVRETIRKAAPDAEEVISYQMPAYRQNGMLVYFAANKNHIGFYPTSSGIATFAAELKEYQTSKGAVQFPWNQPVPFGLIHTIVSFRVAENQMKAELKKAARR
jgi:uncharacterized protein YdhG (YjbR/CyaY superfamily)